MLNTLRGLLIWWLRQKKADACKRFSLPWSLFGNPSWRISSKISTATLLKSEVTGVGGYRDNDAQENTRKKTIY